MQCFTPLLASPYLSSEPLSEGVVVFVHIVFPLDRLELLSS